MYLEAMRLWPSQINCFSAFNIYMADHYSADEENTCFHRTRNLIKIRVSNLTIWLLNAVDMFTLLPSLHHYSFVPPKNSISILFMHNSSYCANTLWFLIYKSCWFADCFTFYSSIYKKIFGPKKDEVRGGCRKLHNEKLHNLYPSPSTIRMIKSRRMSWAGHVARMREKMNAYMILVRKLKAKIPLGWPWRRRVDNIEMYPRESGWGGMDWIDLVRIGISGGLLWTR
jgi:hypothetical protein